MTVSNYAAFNVTSAQELYERANQEGIKAAVEYHEKAFETLDVKGALSRLSEVGELMHLAYAGCKGHKSSTEVLKVSTSYQNFIADAEISGNVFLEQILRAIKITKIALDVMHKPIEGKAQKALELISKCAEFAAEMEQCADKLANQANTLCTTAQAALLAVQDDETGAINKQEKNRKLIEALEAKRKQLESMTRDYAKSVAESREDQVRAELAEKDARNKAFTLGILKEVMKPLGELANTGIMVANPTAAAVGVAAQVGKALATPEKQEGKSDSSAKAAADVPSKEEQRALNEAIAKSAESAIKARAEKTKWLEKQIEANAELAESIAKLQSLGTGKNDLAKAVQALSVAVTTLGRIQTIFVNVKVFWGNVNTSCKSLKGRVSDVNTYANIDEGQYINDIKSFGLTWFALGKRCYLGQLEVKRARERVGYLISHLPDQDEASSLIGSLATDIQNKIKEDNKLLENAKPR